MEIDEQLYGIYVEDYNGYWIHMGNWNGCLKIWLMNVDEIGGCLVLFDSDSRGIWFHKFRVVSQLLW